MTVEGYRALPGEVGGPASVQNDIFATLKTLSFQGTSGFLADFLANIGAMSFAGTASPKTHVFTASTPTTQVGLGHPMDKTPVQKTDSALHTKP